MTLQQIKYVVEIAAARSMNQAAAHLYVSQSALSQTLKDLEEELQIDIFVRTSRGLILTADGEEFLSYARQMAELNDIMEERYIKREKRKERFSVSMQHYSFAVDAFIHMAKEFGMEDYEFAVHETKTREVIDNVKNHISELGIIYINPFNEKVLKKILLESDLLFTPLFACPISVYLAKSHPLAQNQSISLSALQDYPCLSFEQGESNSFYFSEEVFSTYHFRQIIKADDRATMLNLMIGLNGFTLCSGNICEQLNGDGYRAIPLETKEIMNIGYIKQKRISLSPLGKKYLDYLNLSMTHVIRK